MHPDDLHDQGHVGGENHDLHNDIMHFVHDITTGHDWQTDFQHLITDITHPFSSHDAPDPSQHESNEWLTHFDPNAPHYGIVGHPGTEMQNWHQQHYNDTCAIASQEFILQSMGLPISEEALRQEASQHGWYSPGGGTPLNCVGNLLELHGIHVEHHEGATLQQLSEQLQQGHEVIASVNAEDIWYSHDHDHVPLNQYAGMPGQHSDHAVEVIGVDQSDPRGPMVILNDPGYPSGKGLEMPAAQFMEAWSTSNNYMVTTGDAHNATHNALFTPGQTFSHDTQPSVGGYYNADGTYHWESDNTDRDKDTGAVIRQW